MTEIRVLDTYWSDHCRHTTFSTELKEITFGEGDYKEPIVGTYEQYLKDHSEIFAGRRRQVYLSDGSCTDGNAEIKKEGKIK